MKIDAWSVKNPQGRLENFSYETTLKSIDVLISITYCSVTRGDVCFIDNFWGDTKYPLVPGMEIFGVVTKKGPAVRELKIGDYVGIGYQMSSCMACVYCNKGKEQFCKKQKVLSVDGYGGIAKNIVFDSRFVFKIPPSLQTASHVPLMSSALTPFSAIKRSKIESGMTVGLLGIGNLGHLALQILHAMGCRVTVFSHSKEKEAVAKKLGAYDFINSTDEKALEHLKSRFDFILSTSSGSLHWPSYIKALKPQGTICFVGLPAENISFPAILLADYAQKGILGSYIGSRSEMKELIEFASKHSIKAMTEVFSMADANKVIEKIRAKEIPFSAILKN